MKNDFEDLKKGFVSCSLALSLMLTACSHESGIKKAYAGNTYSYTEITYSEDGIISGTLPTDAVDKYVKVVTFKQDDVVFRRLVVIEDHTNQVVLGHYNRTTKYVDLETGTTLISYTDGDISGKTTEYVSYSVGENLEIASELDIMPYFYQEGKFQDVYDVNDIITFYHDIIEPSLDENNDVTLQK